MRVEKIWDHFGLDFVSLQLEENMAINEETELVSASKILSLSISLSQPTSDFGSLIY